eukprot:scaffold593_cov147-Skeletonema_menzelii.AAC.8
MLTSCRKRRRLPTYLENNDAFEKHATIVPCTLGMLVNSSHKTYTKKNHQTTTILTRHEPSFPHQPKTKQSISLHHQQPINHSAQHFTMATSNLSLKSLLSKERVQHVRWAAISSLLTNTQDLQNPVWREHLSRWFFHALETIERFDGNHGAFHRSVAHVAMKILDMFLSSRSTEYQLLARIDERVYKSIAWACLYNAMRRCSIDAAAGARHEKSPPSHPSNSALTVNGRECTPENFVHMCHATNVTSVDQFSYLVTSISSFLDSLECFQDTLPLTASHVFQVFRRLIIRQYPQLETSLFQDNAFLQKVHTCLDRTMSNNRFARHPPSLNSAAAIMVAMPESVDRAVLLFLLTEYRLCGGYALSTLRDVVEELRTEVEEVHPQEIEARDDRDVVHVIPVCDE